MALRKILSRYVSVTAQASSGFETFSKAAAAEYSAVAYNMRDVELHSEKYRSEMHISRVQQSNATRSRSYGTEDLANDCIFELRTYTLKPQSLSEYLQVTAEYGNLRKKLNPGWLGFWTTETGGVLNEVKHLYAFPGGWEERDAVRSSMATSPHWTTGYLPLIRPMVDKQESMILFEAADCMRAAGGRLGGQVAVRGPLFPSPVYELRTYQLAAGYHMVPQLENHFVEGLPERVRAIGCGQCMFLGYSHVGWTDFSCIKDAHLLAQGHFFSLVSHGIVQSACRTQNTFIEIWRHASTAAFLEAQKGERKAFEWRTSLLAMAPLISSCRTELLRPTAFCPWETNH